jgi:hypothetical protein
MNRLKRRTIEPPDFASLSETCQAKTIFHPDKIAIGSTYATSMQSELITRHQPLRPIQL